jgi:hydroxypyruvate isomerase
VIAAAVENIDWQFVTLSRSQYANGYEPLGQSDPRWQERPFAYEIYHQLRYIWGQKNWDTSYTIQAEVLKSYQKIFEVNKMPDLLIHQPNGDKNLAAVEIKMAANDKKYLKDDLDKLALFHKALEYDLKIEILIGSDKDLENMLSSAFNWSRVDTRDATRIHIITLSLEEHHRIGLHSFYY